MNIEDDLYLKEIVDRIGKDLQKLENYLQSKYPSEKYLNSKVNIRFPMGYIRKCETFRERYSCNDVVIKRNVSYAILTTEIIRWILNRFRLIGALQAMVVKIGIVVVVSAIEGIVYDKLKSLGINPTKKFKKNIDKLVLNNLLTESLAEKLHELRGLRSNIHLHLPKEWEYEGYSLADYNKAVVLLKYLNTELQNGESC